MALAIDIGPDEVTFRVRVAPRASRVRCLGEHDGALKIALTAPPVDGAANAALVTFLAKALGVPKTAIAIVRGERAKSKGLVARTSDPEAVAERLRALGA